MSATARSAVKLLAVAHAAVAVLVFLQTFVLLAISYDSPAYGSVLTFFRIAFFASDVAVLVALVRLAGRHAPVKPFALGGVGIGLFSVASGAFNLLSHALGTPTRSERMLQNFARTMSAAEPAVSLGAGILVVFALSAIARARSAAEAKPSPRALTAGSIAFFVTASLWVVITLVRASSRDAQSFAVAWTVWALEIAKALALATCAFTVYRASAASPATDDAAKVGPYREGEAVAPPSGEAELPPPDPATIEPLRRAASGVALYSMAFTIRLVAAFVLTILSVAVMGAGDLWIVFFFLPAVGAGTAIAMLVGLGRQRALPSMRAGARLALARTALGIAAVSDGFFAIAILLTGLSSTGWSAHRKTETLWSFAYPTSALFVGISILLVASGLARSGEALAREALTRRARWAQSLAVASFTFVLGLLFSVGAVNGHDHDQKNGGALVCGGLALAALAVTLAFVVIHVLTQAEAARTLRARLAGALTDSGRSSRGT